MTPLERVTAAFEHRPTDRVPIYQAGISSRVASAVLGREAYVGGGIQQFREARALWEGEEAHQEFLERSRRDAFDLAQVLDLDMVRPSYWRMPERPTKRLDDCTFLYGDPDAGWRVMRFDPQTELYQVLARSTAPEPTLDDLDQQAARALEAAQDYHPQPEHFPDLLAAIQEFGGQRAIPGTGIGICVPREQIWLEAVALRPNIVRRHLEAQAIRAEKNALCMAHMGLRFLMGGGDFASKKGPFYSPAAFHQLMLPALIRVSEGCHAHACLHGFASDGNLWPVAADLFGASGVDFFYEIDLQAGMDLAKLRDCFPHLTLMGGISSETLHIGSTEDVLRETRAALEVAKARGSIIVGCSNQIVAGTPIENFEAMMRVLWRER